MTEPAYNQAITRCMDAVNRAYDNSQNSENEDEDSLLLLKIAFRNAMPNLTDRQSIFDFIACVTHGLLLKFIDDDVATKLLYGAQVALSAHARKQNPASKTGSTV